MKLLLVGVIAVFSVASMVSANYKMPFYGSSPYYGGGSSFGFGSGGSGGFGNLFELIIFLFVFILIIQVLFGTTGGGGLGGYRGGGGYGGKRGGGGYDY